jgi:peroxiredoxin Q/BCP
VILYFYPKDDTPGCTIQACGFRDSHAEFEANDAVVFGISPDSAASHAEFRDKFDLPFTLLVDEGHVIADAYGVWGEKGVGGRGYTGVVRSHFVIGEDGTIVEARAEVGAEDSPVAALATVRASG